MTILETFENSLLQWRGVFPQKRTFHRAYRLMFGLLFAPMRHLISNAICATGLQFMDWSADYRVFSRSKWEPHDLFGPVITESLKLLPAQSRYVVAALDDTVTKKTGKNIPGVSCLRDPMSPPFNTNLMYGLRFVQVSLILTPPDEPGPARSIPIRFEPAFLPKKPGKKATNEELKSYKEAKEKLKLTRIGLNVIKDIRNELNIRNEYQCIILIIVVDGSYTNGFVFKNVPANTIYVGRARKDIKLFGPLEGGIHSLKGGRPRLYGAELPTPESILRDNRVPWQDVQAFAAGKTHTFQVKIVDECYWKKIGCDKPLKLVIVKPVGYRLRKGSKLLYREPAYLLCTDPKLDIETLLQAYLFRWEIECNHRDEKSFIGVAEGQVWNENSVKRLPQFQVAGYSMLLLAAIRAYGFKRDEHYLPQPKWRTQSARPSIMDIINLLRIELMAGAFTPTDKPGFDHFDVFGYGDTKSLKPPGPEPGETKNFAA